MLNIENFENYEFGFYSKLNNCKKNGNPENIKQKFYKGNGYIFEGYPLLIHNSE